MTSHSAEMEGATVGEILRDTRMRLGLDLATVAEETKISPKNLLAMEEGDLASLPAEVYARGYYAIYARMLALDPGEVLEMYGREKKKLPRIAVQPTPPPNRLAQDMANLAERPASPPSSYIGLIILIFLLFGAFLCWYFGWNPASFLSEKLRSLEETQGVEQAQNQETEADAVSQSSAPGNPPPARTETLSLFSPATVTAATTRPETLPGSVAPPASPKYIVNAVFMEETALSLTIDNQPQQTLSFQGGESITWQAGERLLVTLPGDTRTRITLNQIPMDIPQAAGEKVTLAIPEDILR